MDAMHEAAVSSNGSIVSDPARTKLFPQRGNYYLCGNYSYPEYSKYFVTFCIMQRKSNSYRNLLPRFISLQLISKIAHSFIYLQLYNAFVSTVTAGYCMLINAVCTAIQSYPFLSIESPSPSQR